MTSGSEFSLQAQHPALIEAFCVHQALGKLGFPMESIFFTHSDIRNNTTHVVAAVLLKWKGRQFTVFCGSYEGTALAMCDAWAAVLAHQKDPTEEELAAIYEKSDVRKHHVRFVMALQAKGIHPPCTPNFGDRPEA